MRFNSSLARVIRARREELGLSMTQVGIRAGLSQQSVSFLERELRSPNIETLLRICHALDLRLSEIITKVETELSL